MKDNFIENVALVGASGNSGSYIAQALLRTDKHNVTAITRHGSKAIFPMGIKIARIDYDDHASLVNAMRGQDALVITLSGFAPHDIQDKLIKAAAEADVPWILPNEWSPDSDDERLLKDLAMIMEPKRKARELVKRLGKSSYVALCTGFWYEWSLAIPFSYGLDIVNRSMTLFDDGNTPITTSSWPQVGHAVAALLSLPVSTDKAGIPSLEQFRNRHVYIESFTLTQHEMLDSVMRVTNTTKSDWKISTKTSEAAFKNGWERFQGGDRMGLAEWMYGRVFFPDGVGNHAKNRTIANDILKLPKEDVDRYTKVAVTRVQNSRLYTPSE